MNDSEFQEVLDDCIEYNQVIYSLGKSDEYYNRFTPNQLNRITDLILSQECS